MCSNYNLRPAATVTMFYVPVQFLCSSTLKFENKRHLHLVLLLLQIILELGTRQHCRDKVTLFSGQHIVDFRIAFVYFRCGDSIRTTKT